MTLSPTNAARAKRRTSRIRWYGDSNAIPFHPSTISRLDVPKPSTNRPGAASAIVAALWTMQAGPRVNTGTMAVPSRRDGAHTEASANGVNASVPSTSVDHTSV